MKYNETKEKEIYLEGIFMYTEEWTCVTLLQRIVGLIYIAYGIDVYKRQELEGTINMNTLEA